MRYHTLALSSVWFRKTNKNKRVDRDYTSSGNGGFDTRDVDALYGVVDRLSFSATFFLYVCPLYPSDRQTLIMLLDVFGSVNTSLRHIQYLTIMSLYSLSVILVSCLYAMYISVVVILTSILTDFLESIVRHRVSHLMWVAPIRITTLTYFTTKALQAVPPHFILLCKVCTNSSANPVPSLTILASIPLLRITELHLYPPILLTTSYVKVMVGSFIQHSF